MKKTALENQIENLARITKKGFEEMHAKMDKGFSAVDKRFKAIDKRFELIDKGFEEVDKRFDGIDDNFSHVHARLDTLERDVADIRKHFVYRDEFEELDVRVDAVEGRLGIKHR